MDIESISHKALRKFAETGVAKGLPNPDKLARMLSFIADAENAGSLSTPPNFKLHVLTGDRAGTYSMTVTPNWRLTFKVSKQNTVLDLNLEDYH